MSILSMTVKTSVTTSRSVREAISLARASDALKRRWPEFGYAFAVSLAAIAILAGLPGTAPSADAVYAPLSLAVMVGMLLTVRLTPHRPPAAMLLVPAMV